GRQGQGQGQDHRLLSRPDAQPPSARMTTTAVEVVRALPFFPPWPDPAPPPAPPRPFPPRPLAFTVTGANRISLSEQVFLWPPPTRPAPAACSTASGRWPSSSTLKTWPWGSPAAAT